MFTDGHWLNTFPPFNPKKTCCVCGSGVTSQPDWFMIFWSSCQNLCACVNDSSSELVSFQVQEKTNISLNVIVLPSSKLASRDVSLGNDVIFSSSVWNVEDVINAVLQVTGGREPPPSALREVKTPGGFWWKVAELVAYPISTKKSIQKKALSLYKCTTLRQTGKGDHDAFLNEVRSVIQTHANIVTG
ncbi:hypothetical protein O181_092957, partial [Austropuccinia psidii MF-1]|nr:hypothetical protein [Austropuccinia psidii MF-1]